MANELLSTKILLKLNIEYNNLRVQYYTKKMLYFGSHIGYCFRVLIIFELGFGSNLYILGLGKEISKLN